jgi:hypothetical protein
MPTWSGWDSAFLTTANLPDNGTTRAFLDEWAQNANTNCDNNPIDLSHGLPAPVASHATDCKKLPGGRVAKKYASHLDAAHAFDLQIHSAAFSTLLAAFQSGDPYPLGKFPGLPDELAGWGSYAFAVKIAKDFQLPTPAVGGVTSTTTTPGVHKGWSDVRTSMNTKWPNALRASDKAAAAALRALHKASKVKL